MKPSDVPVRDWQMYYAGTWMKHAVHGPALVSVRAADLMVNVHGEEVLVDPSDLECWWPRSGSYNTPLGALYISRKAARNMRKSASWSDHYVCTYGRTERGIDGMKLMVRGPNYMSVEAAMDRG